MVSEVGFKRRRMSMALRPPPPPWMGAYPHCRTTEADDVGTIRYGCPGYSLDTLAAYQYLLPGTIYS
jgi:hypothetical protein